MTIPYSTEHVRLHRKRIREQGKTEILLTLPVEVVETLDRLRASQGVRSRGDVVASLVQQLQEAGNELKIA
jgi:metal-responsive CopG/Arc/MetJ family transcriptional regulator